MTVLHPTFRRNLDDFASISSDWFWETDQNDRFCFFTQRFGTELNNIPYIMGKSRFEMTCEDTSGPKWKAHREDLKARRPFRKLEYPVRREDGRIMWVRISGEPRYDENGAFMGYRGAGQCITEEKRVIARLEASNAALELRNKQLDEARRAIERSAFEDALTNVWNRRAFERDLQDMLSCTDRQAGILHIDLDRFKWVNDTLGHPIGDVVLQMAATRIKMTSSAFGTAYRMGGDEFAIILFDDVDEEQAITLAHQIVDAMSVPLQIGQRKVWIGASVGVVVMPASEATATNLIGQADAALYEAKARGRNTVCAINDHLRSHIKEHRRIAADMPSALEDGEFKPVYQPQMDLLTRKIIGIEVLARWQHPMRGMLYPRTFLKAAQELSLEDEIDRQMLAQGLKMVDRFAKEGVEVPAISVNTSRTRLMDPRLLDDVERLWQNRSCRLSFELLETICFDDHGNQARMLHQLDALRALGVSIETDDFGTGRASITGLLRVKPDRLKIDSSLVNEAVANPEKRSMVKAILDLAQSLGITCVAEGAETQDALNVLCTLGCSIVQGFAVAHPMDEAELLTYLRKQQSHTIPPAPEQKTADPKDLPSPEFSEVSVA